MQAGIIYEWLIAAPSCNKEDTHVLASVMAVAGSETNARRTFADGVGLAGNELLSLLSERFPHAIRLLEPLGFEATGSISDDEKCLRDLLTWQATTRSPFEIDLAAIIARRCMRPNHLWQDLGLRNRLELSALMARHFAPLSARNKMDMKWKKFFYRMICREEGFTLCAAPSCSECDDFTNCFGDESGDSLLAQIRRTEELTNANLFKIFPAGV